MPASEAQPVTEAIGRAGEKGVIFVAAAANDGKNNDTTEVYPANTNLPNVITVAASDKNDGKPSWSNYGMKTVHVASPGILFGAPCLLKSLEIYRVHRWPLRSCRVSVGLMLSHNKALTGPQVKALLQASGTKVPPLRPHANVA